MGLMKSLVEITHDAGYGDSLLMHINNAFGGKDMRAERVVGPVALSVKIEKPKRYRPFANAAEAESLWDAKLQFKGFGVDRFRVTAIRDIGVTIGGSTYKYAEAFERLECSDGTPFGVEVVE